MYRFAPILALACLLLVAQQARAHQARDLTAPEVREMVEEDGALLVHVLSRIEFDMQHIPGSINIPVTALADSDLLLREKDRSLIF
jgi:rhodanese-related sulfurtransferase